MGEECEEEGVIFSRGWKDQGQGWRCLDSSLMERWKEKSAELMNKEQDGEHRVNERNSKVQSNRSRPYWWSRKAGNGQ